MHVTLFIKIINSNFSILIFQFSIKRKIMQLEKAKVRIRCELGACKAKADYTIRMARVGIRSRIHVCSDCLSDLADCIKQANVGAGIDRPL